MKKLLIAGLFALLPVLARAQVTTPQAVQNVVQTYRSTMTCSSILISSATSVGGQATQVISSTQTLWANISIQNKDSTANAYFSDSINVASGTANGVLNANTGFELGAGTPGGSASFYIAPGELFYGVNDSGSRQTVITVCKGH